MTPNSDKTPGTVYLVGAGPGDPGLLTVKALQCLQEADLVLYDYLANPTLVDYAQVGAELIRLGRHDSGRNMTPDEIAGVMVEAALEGKTVVRLKGGDPSIFARGGDEADACRAAGVPFEIVPGITSGLATAAYAEIPLTHFEDASAVALVTGHERDEKEHAQQSHLDYEALAAFPGTLVLYMGVKWAGRWSSALMEHGKSPDTPVAVVQWCSRARQQTVRCTLGTVAQVVGEKGLRPPSLFVVGPVVDRAPALSPIRCSTSSNTSGNIRGSVRPLVKMEIRCPRSRAYRIWCGPRKLVPPRIRMSMALEGGGGRDSPSRLHGVTGPRPLPRERPPKAPSDPPKTPATPARAPAVKNCFREISCFMPNPLLMPFPTSLGGPPPARRASHGSRVRPQPH